MNPYMVCKLAIISVIAALPFQTTSSRPDEASLGHAVALAHSTTTSGAVVSILLSEAHTPGGIVSVYDNCSQPEVREFSLTETTLGQGLDYVSRIDATRTWIYSDGVIVVGSNLADRTILSTIIRDVDIYQREPLSLTAQRVLSTPDVRSRIQKGQITELNPDLGFAQVPRPSSASPSEPSPSTNADVPKRLHNVALIDALNLIAKSHGAGVWEYEQFSCRGKSSFRLNWVTR
jgi:hypothetical protein